MKEQEYTIPDGAGPMPILDDEDPRSWKQIREDALFDRPLLLKEVALATPIKFMFLPSEPDDEHYMSWMSRVIALMTQRVGVVIATRDPDTRINFIQRVRRLNIAYLILSKQVDQALIENMKDNQWFAEFVWENDHYEIFKVKRQWKRKDGNNE